jgi:hypothetical protein
MRNTGIAGRYPNRELVTCDVFSQTIENGSSPEQTAVLPFSVPAPRHKTPLYPDVENEDSR